MTIILTNRIASWYIYRPITCAYFSVKGESRRTSHYCCYSFLTHHKVSAVSIRHWEVTETMRTFASWLCWLCKITSIIACLSKECCTLCDNTSVSKWKCMHTFYWRALTFNFCRVSAGVSWIAGYRIKMKTIRTRVFVCGIVL